MAEYAEGVAPERSLVALLAGKAERIGVMHALLGSANARELRAVHLANAAFDALVDGLRDDNPVVRWWSIQLLDRCADQRATEAIVLLLNDPIPRVRRNAAHAVGCVICKPEWNGELPDEAIRQLTALAGTDPNPKVRTEARMTLACRT
jgi:HEAT repeat protein